MTIQDDEDAVNECSILFQPWKVRRILEWDFDLHGDPQEADDWRKANKMAMNARSAYARLWDKINEKGSWAKNPWVWAISYRRIEQ